MPLDTDSSSSSNGHQSDPERQETPPALSKDETGWRRVVHNFHPSWFAVNMGTGIVSILLHNLPYNGQWLQYISYIFFCLNIFLFVVFLIITIARYAMYPAIWNTMLSNPAQSMFLGCMPMGLATIINMMIFCCKQWGDWLVYLAWGLWWLDVCLAIGTCLNMPFIVMHRHKPLLDNVTAALLLPIVPAVVASATGGILAAALPDYGHAFTTLITSYILWGIGETLAACVLALYFHRLTIKSLPNKAVIVTAFLPMGPLGQGGFGIQQLGIAALKILPKTNAFGAEGMSINAGQILYVLGVFIGMVMWGFGLVWLFFAVVSISLLRPFPFNMGWWGFTFPLGVMATCSNLLAGTLDSDFFRVATTILSLSVLLLWILVSLRTIHLACTGEDFHAPCLKDVKVKTTTTTAEKKV